MDVCDARRGMHYLNTLCRLFNRLTIRFPSSPHATAGLRPTKLHCFSDEYSRFLQRRIHHKRGAETKKRKASEDERELLSGRVSQCRKQTVGRAGNVKSLQQNANSTSD